jgi:hypothetical protein
MDLLIACSWVLFMFHVSCFMFHVSCFMFHGLWFMVYGLWFMVYGLWFMVYGLWFVVHGSWSLVEASHRFGSCRGSLSNVSLSLECHQLAKMTYDFESRVLAFSTYQMNGHRLRATARQLDMSHSTLSRWKSGTIWSRISKSKMTLRPHIAKIKRKSID